MIESASCGAVKHEPVTMIGFPERLRQWAEATPGHVAVSCAGEDMTYAELWQRVERATVQLAGSWRVAAGDRIGYLGINHTDQLISLVALMRLGALLVPLNYRLAANELGAIVAHADISQVIADENFASMAAALGVPARERSALRASLPDTGPRAILIESDPNSAALLVYTSGTTGQPKGAVHTHGGLVWNALASIAMHDMTADDIVLSVLPLFHVGGLCIQTLPALYVGAHIILHPRFDAGTWLAAVAEVKPTISLMVPATMRLVQEHPRWEYTDLSSLRVLGAGSSTIPDALIAGFHARGVPVCQIYGATETGPVSIVLRAEDAFAHAGAAGRPAPGCAIRLVAGQGDVGGSGEVGEIWVKAPNVMQGYWRDPQSPAFADGWFRTGDLAHRDAEGYYTVVGRSRDMIISGGENIYPAEIENVLAGITEIAEAAAIGVPDSQWGEVPVAVVVLREGAWLDESAIRARFEDNLARFKHPRRIVFRASLPRNALGKVQKALLIADLKAGNQLG